MEYYLMQHQHRFGRAFVKHTTKSGSQDNHLEQCECQKSRHPERNNFFQRNGKFIPTSTWYKKMIWAWHVSGALLYLFNKFKVKSSKSILWMSNLNFGSNFLSFPVVSTHNPYIQFNELFWGFITRKKDTSRAVPSTSFPSG